MNNFDSIVVPAPTENSEEIECMILERIINRITEEKLKGNTKCYISENQNGIPKKIIKKLIDAGYDIHFRYFSYSNDWFIKACWLDGCCGRIFNEDHSNRGYVTIDEMFEYNN